MTIHDTQGCPVAHSCSELVKRLEQAAATRCPKETSALAELARTAYVQVMLRVEANVAMDASVVTRWEAAANTLDETARTLERQSFGVIDGPHPGDLAHTVRQTVRELAVRLR